MDNTFYVTTVEDNGREHNFRLPQGDTIPENQVLKSQRPAGLFRFSTILSAENLAILNSIK